MNVKLVWATPDADQMVGYCARVSNPANQENENVSGLLAYCARNGHWSVFEMASACVEINTTRDIGRQILRHRSFSFQEFCVAGNTMITLELPNGVKSGKRAAYKRSIEHLYKLQESNRPMPSSVRVFDEDSRTFVAAGIKEVFKTGMKPTYRITLENGKQIESTKEHRFLTQDGFKTLESAIGLELTGTRATMSVKNVAIACNGVLAHHDASWLASAKAKAISEGTGLAGIAAQAKIGVDAIRKWLRRHGLQFTHSEVASYTTIWNKGKTGYTNTPFSAETVEKMRNSARKGADSNLWRGGADRTERLRIADWCLANRSEFLRAANYACKKCESNERLELHHDLTVAARPDLAYDKSNIVVLCHKCHREHHKLNGDAKNWREKSKGNTLTVNWSTVSKVEYLGEQMTYDMEVDHQSHNYVANGIVTHNSQRYASTDSLPEAELRECRLQDTKNRQNSIETDDYDLTTTWQLAQKIVLKEATTAYKWALEQGIAKEQARALLPEGLTSSRMYMSGTLRSWITYLQSRLDPSTQREHQDIAKNVLSVLRGVAPVTIGAFFKENQ